LEGYDFEGRKLAWATHDEWHGRANPPKTLRKKRESKKKIWVNGQKNGTVKP